MWRLRQFSQGLSWVWVFFLPYLPSILLVLFCAWGGVWFSWGFFLSVPAPPSTLGLPCVPAPQMVSLQQYCATASFSGLASLGGGAEIYLLSWIHLSLRQALYPWILRMGLSPVILYLSSCTPSPSPGVEGFFSSLPPGVMIFYLCSGSFS